MASIEQKFQRLDLVIVQGADFTFSVTAQDADGNSVDLTGYSCVGQIRETATTEVYAEFTCSVSGASGVVTFTLPAAESDKLSFAAGVWDSFLVAADETRQPFLAGKVKTTLAVTPLPVAP